MILCSFGVLSTRFQVNAGPQMQGTLARIGGITFQLVASGGSLPLLFIFRYQSAIPPPLYLPTGIFCPCRDPDVYNCDLRLISWVIGVLW